MNTTNVTINKAQKLYVIDHNKHVSCLGFDNLINRRNALAKELRRPKLKLATRGTLKAYNEYLQLIKLAHAKHLETGWKSKAELIPELIGLEGKRVEVTTESGEKHRFIVGRSTGFIPCHIGRKNVNSRGGEAVMKFETVRVI